MIDTCDVFTALEEDIDELRVMSKFYYWNKNVFVSVPQCAIYLKSFKQFINNLERLSGRLVTNVQHCFDVIIVEEPFDKNFKVLKFKFAKQGFFALYHNIDK